MNMKKHFVFFITLIVFLAGSFKSGAEEFDIRQLKWGMSFEVVKKIENLKDDFYKEEDILGAKIEVLFGCDLKGLYGVTYSTPDKFFYGEINRVLRKKYGEPKTDLDYTYIMKSKDLFLRFPEIVMYILEKKNFTPLTMNTEMTINEKKIFRVGLAKRLFWEYGNTDVLLVDTVDGVVVVYQNKAYFSENKKKFADFLVQLKKQIEENSKKKDTEEVEKF